MTGVHRWQPYADSGMWPQVTVRDGQDIPTRATCPVCGQDPAVKYQSSGRLLLANHGPRPGGCDGAYMPVPDHGDGCWRRHHGCAVTRVAVVETALAGVLAEFTLSTHLAGWEERTPWVDAARVDGWRQVLAPGAALAGDTAPGNHETTLEGSQ